MRWHYHFDLIWSFEKIIENRSQKKLVTEKFNFCRFSKFYKEQEKAIAMLKSLSMANR